MRLSPRLWVLGCGFGAVLSASIASAQPQAGAPTGEGAAADDDLVREADWPFTYKASLFSRGDVRERYLGVGLRDADSIRYRARLGLVSRPIDIGQVDLELKFIPQASGIWNVGGDTLADPALAMHEGSVAFGIPGYRLEVGRFEMVYGDHFVIGNVDWHETGRSFDGIRLHTEDGKGAWLDYFVTLLDEGGGTAFARGDLFFLGAYAAVGEWIAPGLELDFYLLGQLRPEGDPLTQGKLARGTLGARAKQKMGALDYRVEVGAQAGIAGAADVLAYQGDLEVGWFALPGLFRVALEGFFASGDDPTTTGTDEGWDHLYPTAHKWLGFSDIMGGRSNLGGGVLH
ncbi:MAG: alginate export family protein, partial [Myxococcales bacterium]|nr:alginate export family protein [Myxococcales bacterium]